MRYDGKLQEILKKYDINMIDSTKLNDNLEGIIIDVLSKKCAGKKCALWGAGQNNTTSSHAAILITKYATFIQNMICVIDSNPELHGKNFLGFPIIAPEQMSRYEVELVIIASKNSGESIRKNLLERFPSCEYIDIYEEFKKRGIIIYNSFYDENSLYSRIHDMRQEYTKKKDADSLNTLIAYYLSIRDFYYATVYIDEYIKSNFEDSVKYQLLLKELEALFAEMNKINENKTGDISLFYIDALRAKDVFDDKTGDLKIFKRYEANVKNFANMYATAVTTYESMMSVVTGKFPLEEEVYTDDFMHELEEFKILKYYEEKGYELNLLVAECYRIIKAHPHINSYDQLYMSQKLWTLSCKLAEAKKNTFNFVYFPYETHFPLLCGFHAEQPVIKAFSDLGINEFPDCIDRQYQECVAYTDRQFEFYYELLGKNTMKILFSDHSQVVYDPDNNNKTYNMYYKYKELTTHVPFLCSKEGMDKEMIKEYYSMVDFNDIVQALLLDKDLGGLKREIIRYQYYPMHNPKMREHAYQFGFENYIDGIDVFISEVYIYVRTATGISEVYALDDLNCNIYGTEESKLFIEKVKEQYNVMF